MKSIPGKIGIISLMTALFLSFLASCTNTSGTASSSPAVITDQPGKTITFKTPPQRIVSLAPSNTEILYALGLADKIVGVTDYCNYPTEAKQKPSIGGFSTPNIEEVVAKNPDLVLAASRHEKTVIPQLESKGLTVLTLNPKTIDEVLESITLVGKVTGKENEALTLISSMQKRIKAVNDKTGKLPADKRPRVFFTVWHEPLTTAGSGTFHDELIEKAGGINIAHALTGYSKDFSLENLIMANPEVIIAGVGMGTGEDLPLQFIQTESRLKDTAARQNNRIYSINTDIVGRTGPRIVDALEQFAGFIHPELFKQ